MSAEAPRANLTLELAHVLFMDVVGYSQLSMDEQEKQLRTLQDSVRQTREFGDAQATNQLICLPTGDGMALVFFGDPEAPARCAVHLNQMVRSGSAAIRLRMGLHSGPVYRVADINANRNVAGGGINIAQRVMDCGDAGHILVSPTQAELLGEMGSWKDSLSDLGEVRVKHGVLLHLHNLCRDGVGNSALPTKIRDAREAGSDQKLKVRAISAGAVLLVVAALGIWLFSSHRVHALSETDTIVLTDFTNKTDDSVFDDTLKQALSVELAQSPFFNILSDQKVRDTLKLMGHTREERLTPDVARDLCQRTGSKAYVSGSIASLGSQYVIGLNAVNCQTGDSLAQEQTAASGKEQVLKALEKATTSLRAKVGESLSTIQKFDTPIEQATTPSLEALQAYSLGRKTMVGQDDFSAALPLFQRAIHLDANFAMAYASLGTDYEDLGEHGLAAESTQKAYELRERVSEREKFYIESHYFQLVTGDLEKARRVYELWAQTYPRDDVPHGNLGVIYFTLGQHEKALAEAREDFRIDPGSSINYAGLVTEYRILNHLEEARATAEEAQAKKLDSPPLHLSLYHLAFLQNNAAEMERQVAWANGKPGVEDILLNLEAYTAAYFGQTRKARELFRRAVVSALRNDEKETAATYEVGVSGTEADYGNSERARQGVAAALSLAPTRDVRAGAAIVLARAGNSTQAEKMADQLAKQFPQNTIINSIEVPEIRAAIEINHNKPSKAIEFLQTVSPYELGFVDAVYSAYLRGLGYLLLRQGNEAAAEFQKILNHRNIVINNSHGALALLGLARAYALQGDASKARAAYQDFLTLWQNADANIPVLKQAKTEYAKLK